MNVSDQLLTEAQRHVNFAYTCNEVAAKEFPEAAKTSPAFIELIENPLDMFPKFRLVDLHDDFWVKTLAHTIFATDENQFLQYKPSTGLYEPVSETTLIGQITTNLNSCSQHFPDTLKADALTTLKNRHRIKTVVERAKHVLAVDTKTFFRAQSKYQINLNNGVLYLLANQFTPYSPDLHVRHKLPVNYDPEATCNLFSNSFLGQVLDQDDIEALQVYSSQMLQGLNPAQKLLILTGDSSCGKSTLMKVFGAVLGWDRVGIIREQVFTSSQELAHYEGKHLLYCPDMQSQFLNRKEASLFKQLVGGDPLWAETKDGKGRTVIEGSFPVILACNGKPRIQIDQDVEAWARRVVVLHFKKPARDKHVGKLVDLLIHKESSGILNWMLAGFDKLKKSSFQLLLTQTQLTKTNTLLLASESPTAFVRCALEKKLGAVLGSAELYEKYQSWCRLHHLQPFSAVKFHPVAKAELETTFGLKYRHDLVGENGKSMRGWKGLALIEPHEAENTQTTSEVSGEPLALAG